MYRSRSDIYSHFVALLILTLGALELGGNVLAAPAAQSSGGAVNLRAGAISEFEVELLWTARGSPVDGFKIERAADGEVFHQIAQVSRNTTSYIDRNRFPDTRYRYRLQAYSARKGSEYSNTAQARTVAPACPLSLNLIYSADELAQEHLPPIVAVAAGAQHTLVLLATGEVLALGDNSYGQASPPAGLNGVVAISAGVFHSLALKADGTVVAWGDNSHGQASPPAGLNGVVAISAGVFHSLALKADGTVVGWGENSHGEATPPAGLSSVVAISAGQYFSLALRGDGTVTGWGKNDYGQATPPTNLTSAVSISAGAAHGLALKRDGRVVVWGEAGAPPANLANVKAIEARGGSYSLALKSDGTIVGWQSNQGAWLREMSGVAAMSVYGERLAILTTAPKYLHALTAKVQSPNRVDISWTDNSGGEAEFQIDRAETWSWPAEPNWVPTASLGVGVTNYSDRNVVLGRWYDYRVRARNHCGYSLYQRTSVLVEAPDTPVDFAGQVETTNTVILSWSLRMTSYNHNGSKIERAPDVNGAPGAWREIAVVGVTESWTDSSIEANTVYWYRLRGFNGVGNSDYTTPLRVGVFPPAPPGLWINSMANTAWIYPQAQAGVEGYKLERAFDNGGAPGSWAQIAVLTNDMSYYESGLPLNATYWYRARAYNWVGESEPGDTRSVRLIPMFTPSPNAVQIGRSNQVDFSWYMQGTNHTGFKIERADDNDGKAGAWTSLATVGQDERAYVDSTALPNHTWWYRVRAFNPDATSEWSYAMRCELLPPDIRNLTSRAGPNGISLYWNNNSRGYVEMRIWRAIADENPDWQLIADLDQSELKQRPYVDTNVVAGTSYLYSVREINAAGESGIIYSEAVSIDPPVIPNLIDAYVGNSNRIQLSWLADPYGTEGFTVERAPDADGSPGNWVEVGTVLKTNYTYDYYYDDTLSVTTLPAYYWYRVRAFNRFGASDFSELAQVTIDRPVEPERVSATVFLDTVRLDWRFPSPDLVAGFRIERALDRNGAPGGWYALGTTTNTTFTDSHRPLGVTYWYRVRAYNWIGNSDRSQPVSATIRGPAAPGSPTLRVASTNRLDLEWVYQPQDEDGFILERAPDRNGVPGRWIQLANLAAHHLDHGVFFDSRVAAHKAYWYRVKAYNKLGFSDYSEPAFIKVEPPWAPDLSLTQFRDSAQLRWSVSYYDGDIDGYRVERAPDSAGSPGNWTEIANTRDPFHTDAVPTASAAWWYRVRAYNWVGDSPWSPEQKVTMLAPAASGYPYLSLSGTNGIVITVYDWGQQADGFGIEWALDAEGSPGQWSAVATVTNTLNPDDNPRFTDTNAVANATNWYRVRSFNAFGVSDFSAPQAIAANPPKFLALSARPGTMANRVEFIFYALSDEIGGYELEQSNDEAGAPGEWIQVTNIATSVGCMAFELDDVPAGQVYWYRARSYNWVGKSPYSDPVMVVVPAGTEPLPESTAPLPEVTDAVAIPSVLTMRTSHDDAIITWEADGGTTNILQTAIAPGGPYLDLSPAIVAAGPARTTITFTNFGAMTNASPRFYRIRLLK